MKKVFVLLAGILVMLCVVSALAEVSGNYEYELDADGNATIIKYNGNESKVVVPQKLDGHTVNSIGDAAFAYRVGIISISIPDSITMIGSNPFIYCKKLSTISVSLNHPTLATIDGVLFYKPTKTLVCYPMTKQQTSYTIPQGIQIVGDKSFLYCERLISIDIPDSVSYIGEFAFEACFGLTNITIPDSVSYILEGTFMSCENLTNITIPSGVSSIGNNAFAYCTSLTSITIPNGLSSIGDESFYECESLDTIIIPDSVQSIGDYAFQNCTGLTSINIPDSVSTIGANPFKGCEKLTKIIISIDHPTLALIDGVLFFKPTNILVYYPMNRLDLVYEIPQGTSIIGASAFYDCEKLTEINMPNSVSSIGDSAFTGCSFDSITIPDSVSSIGDFAFAFSENLSYVNIPNSVASIGYAAFSDCESLTSITIPDSISSIGEMAFSDCFDLTITVTRNSYAEEYCKYNELNYNYSDSNDWLFQ